MIEALYLPPKPAIIQPAILKSERPPFILSAAPAAAMLFSGKGLTESLYDRTTGTNIGDMTGNAGLAAAFNGTNVEGSASCARANAVSGYVGKQLSASKIISRAVVYPANTVATSGLPGYVFDGSGNATLNLYGKNSAPGSGTDGTLLGTTSVSSPDNTAGPHTITSTDNTNTWAYVWVYVTRTGTSNVFIAEVLIYIYS